MLPGVARLLLRAIFQSCRLFLVILLLLLNEGHCGTCSNVARPTVLYIERRVSIGELLNLRSFHVRMHEGRELKTCTILGNPGQICRSLLSIGKKKVLFVVTCMLLTTMSASRPSEASRSLNLDMLLGCPGFDIQVLGFRG